MNITKIKIKVSDTKFEDSMGNKNNVYVGVYNNLKIQFINSSNQRTLNYFDDILDEISGQLDDEKFEGYLTDPISNNEIYWEAVELDLKGTLLQKEFTMKDALKIQSDNLAEWKGKLKSDCYNDLETYAKETNDTVNDPYRVRRGSNLSNFVANWKN